MASEMKCFGSSSIYLTVNSFVTCPTASSKCSDRQTDMPCKVLSLESSLESFHCMEGKCCSLVDFNLVSIQSGLCCTKQFQWWTEIWNMHLRNRSICLIDVGDSSIHRSDIDCWRLTFSVMISQGVGLNPRTLTNLYIAPTYKNTTWNLRFKR